MAKLFALVGEHSKTALTYMGHVILHDNRAEMEWLVPNVRVVEYQPTPNELVMRLRDHPSMQPVTFPLTKSDFRQPRG